MAYTRSTVATAKSADNARMAPSPSPKTRIHGRRIRKYRMPLVSRPTTSDRNGSRALVAWRTLSDSSYQMLLEPIR
jgi:hypothetical protein